MDIIFNILYDVSVTIIMEGLMSLFIAAIGSFFGAVGGAFIVWWLNSRKERITRIEHLNAATAMTSAVFDIFYDIKKNCTSDWIEQYKKDKKIFEESNKSNNSEQVKIVCDFQEILSPHIDLNIFSKTLFNKTTLPSNISRLAMILVSSVAETNTLLSKVYPQTRNMLHKSAANFNCNEYQFFCLYFGLPYKNRPGFLPRELCFTRYANVINGIEEHIDNVLWFSKKLMKEIAKLSKQECKKIYYKKPPVTEISYIDTPLMPTDDNYKDWIKTLQ